MNSALIKLAQNLQKLNLQNEAEQIYKIAIPTPSEQKTKLLQDPKFKEFLFNFLQSLGLIPNPQFMPNFLNAGAYLKEGITDNTLLLAAMSVATLLPNLSPLAKLFIGNVSVSAEEAQPIAKLVQNNFSQIQATLNKFKEPQNAQYLKAYIPGGELLSQYSDRMAESLRNWFNNILKTSKEEINTQE